MSANKECVEDFKFILSKVIEEEGHTLDQVYNCDETGSFWKALTSKTLALLRMPEHLDLKLVKREL